MFYICALCLASFCLCDVFGKPAMYSQITLFIYLFIYSETLPRDNKACYGTYNKLSKNINHLKLKIRKQ